MFWINIGSKCSHNIRLQTDNDLYVPAGRNQIKLIVKPNKQQQGLQISNRHSLLDMPIMANTKLACSLKLIFKWQIGLY